MNAGFLRATGGGGAGRGYNDTETGGAGGNGGNVDVESASGSIILSDVNTSGGGGGAGPRHYPLNEPQGMAVPVAMPAQLQSRLYPALLLLMDRFWLQVAAVVVKVLIPVVEPALAAAAAASDSGAGGGGYWGGGGGGSYWQAGSGGGIFGPGAGCCGNNGQLGRGGDSSPPAISGSLFGTGAGTIVGGTGSSEAPGHGGAGGLSKAIIISGTSVDVTGNVSSVSFNGGGGTLTNFTSSPFANQSIYGDTVTITSTDTTAGSVSLVGAVTGTKSTSDSVVITTRALNLGSSTITTTSITGTSNVNIISNDAGGGIAYGVANAVSGAGATVNITATNGSLTLPFGSVSVNATAASGAKGGSIILSGSTISITGGSALNLSANGDTAGAGGTVRLTTSDAALGDINIANAAGGLTITAQGGTAGGSGGIVTIKAGHDLNIDMASFATGPGTGGNGATLDLEAGRNLFINSDISVNGNGSGTDGSLTLVSNSATDFTIDSGAATNGVQGTVTADNSTGGTITITNNGGGITVGNKLISSSGTVTLSADTLNNGGLIQGGGSGTTIYVLANGSALTLGGVTGQLDPGSGNIVEISATTLILANGVNQTVTNGSLAIESNTIQGDASGTERLSAAGAVSALPASGTSLTFTVPVPGTDSTTIILDGGSGVNLTASGQITVDQNVTLNNSTSASTWTLTAPTVALNDGATLSTTTGGDVPEEW